MADHVTVGVIALDVFLQPVPVFVGQFQAVFTEHWNDVVVEFDEAFSQYVLDLGFADFELAHFVKVDLVDRAACCDESDKHFMTQRQTSPVIIIL